jgi:hypothetical protein
MLSYYQPHLLILILVCLLGGAVHAEEAPGDVIIAPPKKGKIEEFRSQGRVYMIKVTPSKGKPYFLVDADGDGEFEVRRNELDPDLVIPSWVILKW